MTDARLLYPDLAEKPKYGEDAYFYGPSSYQPILDDIGTILVQVDEDNWQGDSFVLFRDDETMRYGVLVFGWGSCSGCDALQACSNFDQVNELADQLRREVRWDDREGTLNWLNDHRTQELKYHWHSSYWQKFVDQVNEYLS